jgi:hypothetical protein
MAFEPGLVDCAIGKAVDVEPARLHDREGQAETGDDLRIAWLLWRQPGESGERQREDGNSRCAVTNWKTGDRLSLMSKVVACPDRRRQNSIAGRPAVPGSGLGGGEGTASGTFTPEPRKFAALSLPRNENPNRSIIVYPKFHLRSLAQK